MSTIDPGEWTLIGGLMVQLHAVEHGVTDVRAARKAVGVPGGSQALSRSQIVTVTVRGRSFELRRPTLLGAILIKARSLMVHSDPRCSTMSTAAEVPRPRRSRGQRRPYGTGSLKQVGRSWIGT